MDNKIADKWFKKVTRATHVLLVLQLIGLPLPADNPCSCLPKDMKPTDVVSIETVKSAETHKTRKITVEQKLRELKARCVRGKLVDSSGRQIYFHKTIGCWGNPPADYEEILKQQRVELENLRKRYRVVEITCNPSGEPIS